MDDSCAVCAEALEWVAYGACGHKEVCSTCVARLRFICDDRNCCICKTQCDVVFVTKALGDYTKVIKEFSVLPSEPREGRLGPYWYHEDTQAFFDDVDHYKMIKAMCKLSCSECDKLEEQPKEISKRRARFRNIEQLKNHLYHQHRLSMCPLCLEMRKVFICEQKLYTRAQLKQHISTGDSEVDGSESERGGFMGHPMCEFCRTPFYGGNELYTHMETEHYNCHLCHSPGQYEYYRNYDDLEMHFRQGHFLCEDESCLAKKFVVFQSEAEMKRHNTLEHAGRMSRSRRNAALQIPTSFRYRRSNEQDNRRGRGRTFRCDSSDNELSMAIEASLERPNAVDNAFHNPSSDTSENDPIINQVESLSTTDVEGASRYLQAVGGLNSSNAPLHNLAFPPLAPGSSQSAPQQDSDGLPNNTMAAYLRRKNNQKVAVKPVKPVISSGQAWPAAGRSHVPPANSAQAWPTTNVAHGVPPANSAQAWPTTNVAPLVSRGSGQNKKTFGNKPGPSSYASSAQAPSTYASSAQAQVETRQTTVPGLSSINTSRDSFSTNSSRISHSASAPNLVENGSIPPSISDFPPVSVAQVRKVPSTSQPPSQPILEVGNVQSANKSLVEKIRAAVEFDEEKFTVFKDISAQYRQGLVDTEVYLDFVRQFGLLHLVLDLARLCPDAQKQRELINAYNTSMRSNGAQENAWPQGNLQLKDSKKGKGKGSDAENSSSKNTMVKGKWKIEAENSNSKNTLADSIMNSVRELQSNNRPSEEVVEVLSKDGYRPAKGKSKLIIDEREEQIPCSQPPSGQKDPVPAGSGSNAHLRDGGGGSKQRKKTSKFLRVRLGEGSAAALLDLRNSNSDPQPDTGDGSSNSTGALPARGVWKTKPATKLFT